MSIEKERSRQWGLLLYMEDSTHKEAFDKLIEDDGCAWHLAYIVHDKDVDENGELKKSHTHVVLNCKNQIWNSALAKLLGIKENYIQRIRNNENALEYLMHYKDPDKYQYSIDEVKGSLKQKLAEIIAKDGRSESERVKDIFDYITNQDRKIRVTELSYWCLNNGFWASFRRSFSIISAVLNEHNEKLVYNVVDDVSTELNI